jgi:hypothetical protein
MGECLGGYGVMGVYGGIEPTWAAQTNVGRTHIATKGIVQSGLVLNLDAGVSSSYSGSGTTWANLNGSPNITLSNTSFTSDNGGGIIFGSSSASASFSTSGFSLSNGFTISVWVKHTGTLPRAVGSVQRYFTIPSEAAVLRFENNNVLRGYAFDTGGTIRSISISNQILSNVYYHCTYSYDGSVFRLYKNAEEIGNLSVSVTLRTPSGTANLPSGGGEWFEGNMYSVQYYNRALSASEIQQNFIATRSRFGI